MLLLLRRFIRGCATADGTRKTVDPPTTVLSETEQSPRTLFDDEGMSVAEIDRRDPHVRERMHGIQTGGFRRRRRRRGAAAPQLTGVVPSPEVEVASAREQGGVTSSRVQRMRIGIDIARG